MRSDSPESRCGKPGCGALRLVGRPCMDGDCPQRWVHHADHRAALAAAESGVSEPGKVPESADTPQADLKARIAQLEMAGRNLVRLNETLPGARDLSWQQHMQAAITELSEVISAPIGDPERKAT